MLKYLALSALLVGCGPKRVDQITIDRALARAVTVDDVGLACAMGASLRHPLSAATPADEPPERALIIADTAAALCLEPAAWDAELEAVRARYTLLALGPARVLIVQDLRIAEDRARTAAALRFARAWHQADATYGPIGGDTCPDLPEDEEIVYLLGLFSGLVGLLHDRKGGGEVGLPLDTVARISRGAACLDDARWWHVPGAFQAAAAVLTPSDADGDPWAALEEAAAAGEDSGVRLARALQVLLAANAGESTLVEQGITSHAQALERVPMSQEWALFDAYATAVTLHESDLLWLEARGTRTPRFGDLPEEPEPETSGPDPFGDDPFAADPAPTEE